MVGSDVKTGAQTYSTAIADADNYTRWILSELQPFFGRSLLEVGLGHGGYRQRLPTGIEYLGLDIDPDCVARAQARHGTDDYLVADVTDPGLAARLSPRGIDTVLCINVLEHIDRDESAVDALLAILPPGGHLLVLVPAFPALYSDLDRMAGHVRRYTFADVPRLARANATVVRQRYFNAVGGAGWWVNKALRHSSLDSSAVNGQIRLFDRFVVPLARGVDHLTRGVFGQSLICVFRKL
ncbi:MAG: class I SAM-dependent methyltransferase [Sphingobacteriia bacterium]|nr:class I SAM-dependent methyltransferase [Sphingobacteriia bacterium]NCC40389.1 class I SAM-dependent methyltransferase [Gammaproteobacteria bacterium]